MACKCAERMRKYVLPFFGYTLVDGNWITDSVKIPKHLRSILDTEVQIHYSVLTAKISLAMGEVKFKEWWTRVLKE
jgi:hypothetical protein